MPVAHFTPGAALASPFELFAPAFAQRALLAVLLLALIAAALGWAIVLRDLPFFTHAVGTGAYPVLVLGAAAGVSTALSAIAGTVVFALLIAAAFGTARMRAADVGRRELLIGLSVAAALALGAVLAQHTGPNGADVSPEGLLFGSLLTIDGAATLVLAVVAGCTLLAAWLLGERWLATGFDPGSAGSRAGDPLLLLTVAIAAGAALPVTGALLAGALLVVPAASARMLAVSTRALVPLTLLYAALSGIVGLYLALAIDLPVGAAIALVAGAWFFVTAAAVNLQRFGLRRTAVFATPALALLLALTLAGCGGDGAGQTTKVDEPLAVVATTPQVADIVRQVGGRVVDVTTLLPAGTDPHDFEPRPSALAALTDAAVIFRSGGDADAWLLPATRAAGTQATPVDLSRSALLLEHASGTINSHWYLDPGNVARAAQRVRDELIKAQPDARETFRANASKYLEDITATHDMLRACTRRIPVARRVVMSGHDDFSYLADAFGLRVAAQITAPARGEPSAAGLQLAVQTARRTGVRAVVVSRGESGGTEKAVADRLGVPMLQLYSDQLTTGDDGSTLLDAIGYDVARIADAVSGGKVRCAPRR